MKRKSVPAIFLGLSFVIGFSISTAKATPPMPEIVTCYYAQIPGTAGSYRCEAGQSCTWFDDKDPYMPNTKGECLRNPGEELLN